MCIRDREWYFKTTPGEELLDACKKLRSYITTDESAAPDLFIKMFASGQPITAEEYDALTVLRLQNTGKNRGVFDLDFDKREFSAVHIMNGWWTWEMRDVSAAVYHATRSQFASSDDKWRKLLDHLSGKEITSAGHLSARNFSFGDEIIESNGKLNFYVQTEFDVDAAFGTFVLTDENDDWLNVYALSLIHISSFPSPSISSSLTASMWIRAYSDSSSLRLSMKNFLSTLPPLKMN